MIESSRLLFVGGLHRSGTTPLARCLGAHLQVSGLTSTDVKEDEGQHLQSVYPKAKKYGGAGRFAMDSRAHLTERSPLVSSANAATLLKEWEPFWDTSRRVLLEKSPPNLIMGRFLQALFPDSAYVAVVRHPLVVALSTHKWRRLAARNVRMHTTHYQLVEHWKHAHETFLEDLPSLSRVHVLRYENLVVDPRGELEPIARLLGLADGIDGTSLRATHSDRYSRQWEAMATGGPIARRTRSKILRDFGGYINSWGYDPEDLSAPPVGPVVAGS